DTIGVVKYLQSWLPPELQEKIKWLNSNITLKFKEAEVNNLVIGDTWGLCMMESFGMMSCHCCMDSCSTLTFGKGMDIPNITLVIQWQVTCKLSTVWQHFGHAVRDCALQGTALLFAEKEHFDDVYKEKQKHQQNKKRK
ncbi:hypothetical protein EDD22DRAFT_738048, partial [Suillus occidentalis]